MPSTYYFVDVVVDYIFNQSTINPISEVYVALYSLPPDKNGGGREFNYNDYERQRIEFGDVSVAAATCTITNSNKIVWNRGISWADPVTLGIFDAKTGGQLLFYKDLSNAAFLGEKKVVIPIGNFSITI